MKTYDVNWNGLDRGHEGAWSPDVWRDVLNAIAKYSPVNLDDTTGQFYTELATKQPGTQWVTVSPTGDTRTFFRDGREPWASTGVVSFNKGAKTATLTSVGRQVVEGVISYADVLASVALGTEEKGDHPFEIILDAMRRAPSGVGLAYEDVVKVMRHYRRGDDIAEVLNSPNEIISANSGRRLKAILLLMTYAGLAVHKGNLYYAGQDVTALRTLTGMDLREAFKNWIMENNAEGSGKAATYITALEDADIIAQAFNEKFKLPSVYEMSDASLESLRDFIANEQNLESHAAGSSVLNGIAGLHGKSYWEGGHCGAAIGSLLEFKRNLHKRNSESEWPVAAQLFFVALKLFAERRKVMEVEGWLHEGRSVNGMIREYFGSLTAEQIAAFSDADLQKFFCHSEKDAATEVVFEHMWSGKNGQGWGNIKPSSATELKEATDYLVKLRQDTSVVATFLHKGAKRPKGFGPSVVSELLMKFHPESCIKHGSVSRDVLKYLGLVDFESEKSDYDEDEYKLVCGAAALILARMKAMKLPRQINVDGSEDKAKPDYLTVNEFIWFVNENKQEISRIAKEKAMAKQQKKPTKDKVTTGTATISGLLANKEDSLMTMLTAALLTKPLVILAGVSGTGKSRMVRHLAYKTCLDKDLQPQGGNAPGNFKMIQVKPNWHDSADLLGYRSVVSGNHEFVTTEFVKFVLKAHAYPDTPFFVCLDEMNLAPVEHYFAEFLSACESIRKNEQGVWISDPIVSPTDFDGEIINLGGDVKFESDDAPLDAALKARKALIEKEGLFIPRNLFVVGTVNMDDTTNGFSRKVLDRAMTIEMNEVKFDELQKKDEGLSAAAANVFKPEEIKKFIDREDFDGQAMLNDEFRDQMEALRGKLEKSPFALAYRFARETTLYRKALMTILNPAEVVKDASGAPKKDAASTPIDAERACGEIALDHMILMKVLPRFTGTVTERETIIKDVGEYLDALIKDKKVGKVKLDDMVERAKHNGGYLSFWP